MPIYLTKDSPQIALKKLKARESVLRQFEEIAGLGSWEVDLNTKKSVWSKRSYEIYGLQYGSDVSIETFFSMLLPEYVPQAKQLLSEAMRTGKTLKFTGKLKRADGQIINLLINARVIYDEHQKPFKLLGTTQDITEISAIKEEYKKQAKILQSIHDSVISTDIYGNIQTWNNGSENLFAYSKEEILGKSIQSLYSDKNENSLEELLSMLSIKSNFSTEVIMNKKDGSEVICDISLSLLRNDIDEMSGYIGYLQDITQQKETEKLLEEQTKLLKHQAYHDMLTALPNRMLFHDRLEQAIAQAKRNNEKFALLFIDLDQFKNINDSLGHHIGDKVLIETASRLRSTIREQDTLSRLGGDEFTIILRGIETIGNATTVARKIISSIKEPMNIATQTLYISSSIGISVYPDDTTVAENLIKYADVAMYRAKDEGRDNFQLYSSEMTAIAFEKIVMENSLRVAIQEEQFEIYYQPQYNLKNESLIGMEALVRWEHPSLGTVPPKKFIPLAETTGLIVALDKIVMREAMQQFVRWYEKGLKPGILALNLAMRQLKEKDYISYLFSTMQELHFKPEWLELEITEGQMMSNPDLSIKKLQKLYKLGIEIAIDDFGTGYSSLSYLKKMPLSKLKIDQSFVHDIPNDEDDVAIIKAIIALGRSLNLKLIAEGVETEEQKEFLLENACDYAQGYLYSKPIATNEMQLLLETNEI